MVRPPVPSGRGRFFAYPRSHSRYARSRIFDVFHCRERDRDEVDVVLEFDDGTVIGIEVKAAVSCYAA